MTQVVERLSRCPSHRWRCEQWFISGAGEHAVYACEDCPERQIRTGPLNGRLGVHGRALPQEKT